MKERDAREFISDLRRSCGRNGLGFRVNPKEGNGSHVALVIWDLKVEDLPVTLIIPGHKKLSPGVQREILKRIDWLAERPNVSNHGQRDIFERTAWWAARIALAEAIREILRQIFHG